MTVTERMTTAPPDDPVRAALADPGVLAKLHAHAHAVLRGAAADADEVVQDTYLRAWQKRDTFDPAVGSVCGWLFGIAANVLRETVRRHRPRPTDPHELSVPASDDADRAADLADVRFRVERHLNRLPDEFRAAVVMRHLEDADYPEIAERLKITPVNARMRVSRGLKLLRDLAAANPKEDRS